MHEIERTVKTPSRDIIPPEQRIGISRAEAAALIGISVPTFDSLVRTGLMPRPRAIGTRRLWYRPEVENAFFNLPYVEIDVAPPADKWD